MGQAGVHLLLWHADIPRNATPQAVKAAFGAPEVVQSVMLQRQGLLDSPLLQIDGQAAEVWSAAVVLYQVVRWCYAAAALTDQHLLLTYCCLHHCQLFCCQAHQYSVQFLSFSSSFCLPSSCQINRTICSPMVQKGLLAAQQLYMYQHPAVLQLTQRLPSSSPRSQDHMVLVRGSAFGWDDMQHLTDATQRHQEWASALLCMPSAWVYPFVLHTAKAPHAW